MYNSKIMGIKGIKKKEPEEKVKGIYGFVLENAKEMAFNIYSRIKKSPVDKGGIFMVVGPLSSGKSIVALEFDHLNKNKKMVLIQPKVDREDVPEGRIYSRSGQEIRAFSFERKSEIEKVFHEYDIVVCDEVQFIPEEVRGFFLKELTAFMERGGWFVGLAVDFNSQGEEFIFPALLKERSVKVCEMVALCQMCGKRAGVIGQRLINGKPTSVNEPELMEPSDVVTYEPRCKDCFVVKK